MRLAVEITVTVLIISLFCISHSILASNWVKKTVQKKLGNLIAYYRLTYNVVSAILLMFIYLRIPQIDVIVYDLPNPYDLIILSFQVLSLSGLVWCARYFSSGEFLDLNQFSKFQNENYNLQILMKIQLFVSKVHTNIQGTLFTFSQFCF